MIKIAIIGMGRMGRIHLDNLSRKINGVELTMVVDPKNDGQKFALDNGVKNVSNSVNAIIENPEIDAVVISSPSSTHCEYVIKFAKAGKAIFCEKPIDMSLQKATKAISIISKLNSLKIDSFDSLSNKNSKDFIIKSISGILELHNP